jgi:hypothetical protein
LRIPDIRMREQVQDTHIEPRWPVVLAVIAVCCLVSSLPGRVRVFPAWVAYLGALSLIVPMAVLPLMTTKTQWLRIESAFILLFFALAGFGTVAQLTKLLSTMVRHSNEHNGLQLLTSSIAVWVTNVLIFSLAYWRTDRGGPEARANCATTQPDWLFPQESASKGAPLNWHPTFIDYLFLSYCTATAFSPAEAQPLTPRAMLLLMLESSISLITIIAVAARAINILGS